MDLSEMGRWLAGLGVALVVAGGVLWLLGGVPGLGRLPGDFQFQTGNVGCFAPLATMLLVSLVLTIILNILLRLFQK